MKVQVQVLNKKMRVRRIRKMDHLMMTMILTLHLLQWKRKLNLKSLKQFKHLQKNIIN